MNDALDYARAAAAENADRAIAYANQVVAMADIGDDDAVIHATRRLIVETKMVAAAAKIIADEIQRRREEVHNPGVAA